MKKMENFDEDMQQVLFRMEEETGELFSRERKRDVGVERKGKYECFSLGKTSQELEEEGLAFFRIRKVASDYNGPQPTYRTLHLKLLYNAEHKLLGAQMIGEGNLEKRYEVLKSVLEGDAFLSTLAKSSVYGRALEEEMDILNLAAFYAMEGERKYIRVEEVRNLQKEGAFFLDVREEEEHDYARILGSKNIPLRQLTQKLSEIPKEEKVYVYCRSAHRSLDAVNFLRSLGYENVYDVEGGFIALSYEEYTKDKTQGREKILSAYHFD